MYGFKELLTFVFIMQTQDTITSAQNPKIKALLQLQQKSACRKEQGGSGSGLEENAYRPHSGQYAIKQYFNYPLATIITRNI